MTGAGKPAIPTGHVHTPRGLRLYRQPPINSHFSSRDIAALIRSKEHNQISNFTRCTQTLQRRSLMSFLVDRWVILLKHDRIDIVWVIVVVVSFIYVTFT